MTIHLPSDQQSFVQGLVSAGVFESEERVILAALELLKSQQRKNAELKALLQPAIDQLDRGEGIVLETEADIDAYFDQILNESND